MRTHRRDLRSSTHLKNQKTLADQCAQVSDAAAKLTKTGNYRIIVLESGHG